MGTCPPVDGEEADVDAALTSGAVVRSWPMRGTLMMMARADSRWLTELLAPRSFAASAGVWRAAGLVERDFDRAAAAARDVLGDGAALSRAALLAAFEARGVETGGGRGSHLIRRIAGEGTIVFGPPRGTEQTFALLDEWVPEAESLERDDALERLAERYVAGHGPATAHDLAWWSGLTVSDARRAVALAGDALVEVPGGLLVSADDPAPVSARRTDVRLLPPFDELLLGYRDRTASLATENVARVVPYSNGLFSPTLTVDGRVVGVWRRALGGSRDRPTVEVSVEPFAPLARSTLASTERRAAEYARYLGRGLAFSVAA
ncbi:hypothetical protein GCM10025867_40680 [Frondihabitans sucicola]|uniref:Winged helix DNA-binding domain-containing protein n=1 Tax=Frondihabitans sucicola TaxID=1268041 RepID=A0ABN6Y6P4_9MICO|nr:winged helix DNA-binding domain-containing protein [Frondihabitans sucicola]BDZ51827.1 hypothetical protein GCM10025867_40680 [Frondihabitans sucicola]